MNTENFILVIDCPDRRGVVAAASNFIADRDGLILEASHFREPVTQRSYMRTLFSANSKLTDESIRQQFQPVAKEFDMQWSLHSSQQKCKTLIAVSKQDHCLNAILYRWRNQSLPINITGVVSNHEKARALVEWHGLPFHYLPVTRETKADQEKAMLEIFNSTGTELLVLARYMQILSAQMSQELAGKCINIHHSFLPGFKGARPYHQAYERGVKIIGATSHYVTADLDEGPIIEQAVERVDHSMDPRRLIEIGNDIESVVLNRAIRWHAEQRIFVRGNRTVILT